MTLERSSVRKLLWLVVAILAGLSFWVIKPFIFCVIMGVMFAIPLIPLQQRLEKSLHLGKSIAAIVLIVTFLITIIAPIAFVTYKSVELLREQQQGGNSRVDQIEEGVTNKVASGVIKLKGKFHLPISVDFMRRQVKKTVTSIEQGVMNWAKETLAESPEFLLKFTMMLIAMFIVLAQNRQLCGKILTQGWIARDRFAKINQALAQVCKSVLFSNIITGLIQASLVALGALIATDLDWVLVFVFTFVVAFIPVIGAAPVAVVMSLQQFFAQQYLEGSFLMALSVIVGVSDNILRAFLIDKDEKDSHPFLNLLATLGGIYLWGIPGLFMGPLVVSFSLKVVPLLIEEISVQRSPLD